MPSPSLLLGVGTILSTLTTSAVAAKYKLQDSFSASNWETGFGFETYDKNFGFVNYVDGTTAKNSKLYKIDSGDVVFGVDASETLNYKTDKGRKSVRLEGKKEYNHGLFILDVKQMPGACGMWPAFWSLGNEKTLQWPAKGEIDIIENVNKATTNKYVLHTDTMCKTSGLGQSGTQGPNDCALDGPNKASGCDVSDTRPSFGPGLKATNGGYYVMEWDSDAIKIWYFPRNSPPQTLLSSEPDTSKFGPPAANFQGDCDIDQRFKDHRFIFTNNFCGEWAGQEDVYRASGCPTYAGLSAAESCRKYVAETPKDFANQMWRIGSFKTYNKRTVSSSSSSMARTSSSSRISSSTKVASTSSSAVRSSSTKVSSASSSAIRSSSASVRSSSAVVSSVRSSSSVAASSHASTSSHASSSSVAASSHASVSSHVASSSAAVSSHASASSSVPVVSRSSDIVSFSVLAVSVGSASSVAASSTPVVPNPIAINGTSSVIVAPTPVVPINGTSPVIATPTPEAPINGTSPGNSTTPVPNPIEVNGTSSILAPSGTGVSPINPTFTPVSAPYGNFTAPISIPYPHSTPVYGNPVYGGDNAKSTPCTTSKGAASTPGYPVYPPNSVPVYGNNPVTTSKPVYGDYNSPPVSKTTITTTYTSTYVDVCETGYTTIKTTYTVTYCPTTTPPARPTPGKPNQPNYPPPGWKITTKVCNACEGTKTVTVTVPCKNCYSKPTPPPSVPSKPSCNGSDCKDNGVVTTKVYQTKVITLTKVPIPESQYYAKSSAPVYSNTPVSKPSQSTPVYGGDNKPSSKPNEPAKSTPVVSQPLKPTPPVYGGGNVTMSYGTGVQSTPTKTGYKPPVFTGAAASVQVGVVAVAGAFAAFFL